MRFVCLAAAWLAAGCGPDDLFVNGNVGLDDDCNVKADEAHAVPLPVFDIAPGARAGSSACEDPFLAQLWVDNPGSARARVTGAEVRLQTLQQQTLRFDLAETPLPNPFLVSAAGPLPASGSAVVALELIPLDYAPFLSDFTDAEIEARVQLQGVDEDGDELESDSFRFPIRICDGCRTLCASDPRAADAECSDEALGPLRTFCVDPEC